MKTMTVRNQTEKQVLDEAKEIMAEELQELNERSRFCYTPTEIAKGYRMSGSDLNSFLRDRGIIQKLNGSWCLTRGYRNQDLAEYRYSVNINQHGEMKMKAHLVWTEKGRTFIKKLIKK